jgi:hypothetical protein
MEECPPAVVGPQQICGRPDGLRGEVEVRESQYSLVGLLSLGFHTRLYTFRFSLFEVEGMWRLPLPLQEKDSQYSRYEREYQCMEECPPAVVGPQQICGRPGGLRGEVEV